MKKTITFLLLVSIIAFSSCVDDPRESEQYKKELYLIGGYNEALDFELNYNDTQAQEAFVTVTSSGSLNIDERVIVELELDEEILDSYNKRYLGEDREDEYLVLLDESHYTISSMTVELDPNKVIYNDLKISVTTLNMDPDVDYALPFRMTSASAYSIGKDSTVILKFKMKNEYSGEYDMKGTLNDERIANNIKILSAISQYEVRMFVDKRIDDVDNTLIHDLTVVLKIGQDGRTVTISDWGNTDSGIQSVSGSGTYDKAKKSFSLNYTYELDGTSYTVTEEIVLVLED